MNLERPNILFLLSDEHSYRHMGHVPLGEGGEEVLTPAFDNLAAHGTRYSDTYCQVPLCTPSRISLLTGLEAPECGAWGNESPLRDNLPTVASTLGAAGYQTCLVGKMHLGGRNQFAGFAERPYGDFTAKTGHQFEPVGSGPDAPGPYVMPWRTRDAGLTEFRESMLQERIVNDEGLAFAREAVHRNAEAPWFLCLSYSRPHFPLTTPPRHWERYWPSGVAAPKVGPDGVSSNHPLTIAMRTGFQVDRIDTDEERRARAGYFACVTYMDEIIGDLLAQFGAAGLLENTVIVYTSDHGELAGEHGLWWKHGWFEACTRVPLIVSTPGQRAGKSPARIVREPVGLYDLYPTFCGIAGIDPPNGLAGMDLSPSQEDRPLPTRFIVSDALNDRWGPENQFRMVRYGSYKYVRFRGSEDIAFDLSRDPNEEHGFDLSAAHTPKELDAVRDFAYNSIDFKIVAARRISWQKEAAETGDSISSLDLPPTTGNLYVTPKGKLINSDDVVEHPTVVVDEPFQVFTGRRPEVESGLGNDGTKHVNT